MAENGVNQTEDANMTDYDGEKVVTMMDVLQEQEAFEEDANAVLGASDDKNCTYSKGYVKRQAIYACLTCCPDSKNDASKRAGVCLACSLHCHENHDLIELYTKRLFRCDCGNPKFNGHPCTFTPNKTDLNWDNKYNQNFSGLYCTCHRPYPDPESSNDEEMIQCIICEDWLHANHMEATVPANEQYAEMICKDCMEDNDFLHDYTDLVVNVTDKEVEVYDPDLDVSDAMEALKKDKLLNGAAADEKSEGDTKTDTNNFAKMAPKDKTSEGGEGNIVENASENKTNEDDEQNKLGTEERCSTVLSETKEDSITEQENTITTSETKETPESSDNKEEKQEPTSADAANEKKEPESISEEPSNPEVQEQMEEDKLLQDDTEQPEKANTTEAETTNDEKSTCVLKEAKLNDAEVTSDQKPELESIDKETIVNNTEFTSDEKPEPEPKETKPDDAEFTIDESKSGEKENTDVPEDSPMEDAEKSTTENKNTAEFTIDESKSGEKENTDVPEDSPMEDAEKSTTENKNTENVKKLVENGSNSVDSKRKLSTEDDYNTSAKKTKLIDEVKCARPRGVKRSYKGSTFWPGNFRQKLCTCGECLDMYKDLAVLFLIDLDDTVTAYEALGKERVDGPASQYEKGLQALSSLDRVQQINALTEYNNMRDKLLDFLKSFKDRQEVVKEEDIKEFFAGMKPKREPDGVYFCR